MTEESQPTQEQVEEVPKSGKSIRSPAQIAALEAARQKALAIRTQKAVERKRAELEQQAPPVPEEDDEKDVEVEVVKKTKSSKPKPPKRRIVVVEESSSSEEEIEVRLPKRRASASSSRGDEMPRASASSSRGDEMPRARDERFDQSMRKLFSL